jgi:hypothetical protein
LTFKTNILEERADHMAEISGHKIAASRCISLRRDFKLCQSEHVGKLSIKGKT